LELAEVAPAEGSDHPEFWSEFQRLRPI